MKMNDSRMIIISNRVPFNISFTEKGTKYKKSVGGLVTAIDPFLSKRGGLWIGWSGLAGEGRHAEDKVNILDENKKISYVLKLIELSKKEVEKFYYGFTNRTIWPLFHGFIYHSYFGIDYWKSFKKVNNKFAKETLNEIREGDIIWIHDYHLLLLANQLRKERKDLKILFFLHIPFPNYEAFRVLPWAKETLEGMLGSDIVGFQTKRDCLNFLDSCNELLKYKIDFDKGKIFLEDRTVVAKSFPISIDYGKFNELANQKKTIDLARKIKRLNRELKLVISVERLDYTKGIKERLYGIERFFDKYPEYKKKIVFIQIAVPSRTKVKEYMGLKREIDELVGRINGRYTEQMWSPILYIYKTIQQKELIAYYQAADICLVTPLRDGMNLVTKEYVSSKIDDLGVMILSEFAGAAHEMKDNSIMVNPYNIEEIADSLYQALNMSEEEQKRKISNLKEIVKENDVFKWANNFLNYYLNQSD
jgi:trehalose 6-phosphate synthase/phosphatase